MAKVALVLDDVVLALKKGKRQVAEEKANLSIPATMSPNGKRRNLRLDVSDEGKSLLDAALKERDKMLEKVEEEHQKNLEKLMEDKLKSEQDAWKELNKIADKVEETRPTRKRKKVEEDSSSDHAVDSDTVADTSDNVNTDSSGYQSQDSYASPASPSWQ